MIPRLRRFGPALIRTPGSTPGSARGRTSGVGGDTGSGGRSGTSTGITPGSQGATIAVGGSAAPILFDDTLRTQGRNGAPALASLIKRETDALNRLAFSGKPYFNFFTGGVSTTSGHVLLPSDPNYGPAFRQVYCGRNFGNVAEGAQIHWASPPLNQQANQGWGVKYFDTTFANYLNYTTMPQIPYPTNIQTDTIISARGFVAPNAEMQFFSGPENGAFSNGPILYAGMVYQQPQDLIDQTSTGAYIDSTGTVAGKSPYVGTQRLHQGGEVVAITATADSSDTLQKMRVNYVDTLTYRRGQVGWSAIGPGTGTGYVAFTTSKSNFRYIFDQSYGSGGTSFAASLPAITLPLRYSAAGLYTQVRIYVFVYAAMNGATDTGTIGVANRDSAGSMSSSATAITNAPTISGATFKWYPDVASSSTASLNFTSAPYFLGYAGAGAAYDRIALCAKSNGTTDSVRIGAFTLIAFGAPF